MIANFNCQLIGLLIQSLLIQKCESAWVKYTQFDGYIPSYTYPIQLNAGDIIDGFLTWPGSEDLDIYLYRAPMDLLSRNSYIDREYSPNLNPENLVRTITTPGLYYLRIDLFSHIPTFYEFRIKINGQLISKFYDTVITVDSGRTVKQFSVSGPCDIRVLYDGPIYDLYLFAPGVNVITGTPVASNTLNVNPKQITYSLTSGGNWNIIIHHGLTSETTLIPFRIVVETDSGVSRCINFCTNIPNTDGMVGGTTSTCYCKTNYIWDDVNKQCLIDCSAMNSSALVGPIVPGTTEQCSCLKSYQSWSLANGDCLLNCSLVPYSSGTISNTTCGCVPSFIWNPSDSSCIRNCSAIEYALTNNPLNTAQCTCQAGFFWDPVNATCQINCTNIAYTTIFTTEVDTCQCRDKFLWNLDTLRCEINCLQLNYTNNSANATVPSSIVDVCQCVGKFFWNIDLFQCVINCSSIDNTVTNFTNVTANLTLDECLCEDGFYWNPDLLFCQPEQMQVVDGQSANWVNNDPCSRELIVQVQLQKTIPLQSYDMITPCYYNHSTLSDWLPNNDVSIKSTSYSQTSTKIQAKTILNIESDFQSNFICLIFKDPITLRAFLVKLEMRNPIALALYTEKQCQSLPHIENLMIALQVIGYLIMLFGMLSLTRKLVGLELLGVFQLAYFATFQHFENVNIYAAVLAKLRFSNGLNMQIFKESQSVLSPIPEPMLKLSQQDKYLSNNFNIMVIVCFIYFLTLLIVSLIAKYSQFFRSKLVKLLGSNKKPQPVEQSTTINRTEQQYIERPQNESKGAFHTMEEQNEQNMSNLDIGQGSNKQAETAQADSQPISYFGLVQPLLKQGAIVLGMFNIINFAFSSTLFYEFILSKMDGKQQDPIYLSHFFFISFTLFTVLYLFFFSKVGIDASGYGEFKDMFKYNHLCRMYVPMSILYRIILCWMMAHNIQNMYGTLFVLFVTISFVIFNMVNLPFSSTLHNYRAMCIHLTEMIILFAANYYRSMKANTGLALKSHLHGPAMLVLACLIASTFLSLFISCYEVAKTVRKGCLNRQQIKPRLQS